MPVKSNVMQSFRECTDPKQQDKRGLEAGGCYEQDKHLHKKNSGADKADGVR